MPSPRPIRQGAALRSSNRRTGPVGHQVLVEKGQIQRDTRGVAHENHSRQQKASSWGMTSTNMGNREANNTAPSCHLTGAYRPGCAQRIRKSPDWSLGHLAYAGSPAIYEPPNNRLGASGVQSGVPAEDFVRSVKNPQIPAPTPDMGIHFDILLGMARRTRRCRPDSAPGSAPTRLLFPTPHGNAGHS